MIFSESGVQVPKLVKTSMNDLAGRLAVAIPEGAEPQPHIAAAAVAALNAAGIDAGIEPIVTSSLGGWYDGVVHVIVGRKAP